MILEAVESVCELTGQSLPEVCRELNLPESNLRRWKERRQAGKELVGRRGPGKDTSFDFFTLIPRLQRLAFGRKRTGGVGDLFAEHREKISRRDFYALVDLVRRELQGEKKAMERRVECLEPGMVWSMDDADVNPLETGHGHMHVVHDLGSRNTLRALGSQDLADGWTVAASLADLFEKHGAPLVLKMDNGSNLNHREVCRILDEYGVIPLVSPAYYPPYNGAIENRQRELKRELAHWIGTDKVSERELVLATNLCAHELNLKPRESLDGRTACRVLEDRSTWTRQLDRRDRKEALAEITLLAVDILSELDEHTEKAATTAYRHAVESWLQLNNIIRITRNGEVLPPSSSLSHQNL